MAATTLGVAAAPRQMCATASASTTAARTTRVGAPLPRQLRGGDGGVGGLRPASFRVPMPGRRNNDAHHSQRRKRLATTLAPRAFAPAAGDFEVSLPEGAAALGIVFGSRVLLIGRAGHETAVFDSRGRRGVHTIRATSELSLSQLSSPINLPLLKALHVHFASVRSLRVGLAKAGIGRNIDKYLAKCAEYGIETDDLYYKEDQPGDAWYLVGDWKPVGDYTGSGGKWRGALQRDASLHAFINILVFFFFVQTRFILYSFTLFAKTCKDTSQNA